MGGLGGGAGGPYTGGGYSGGGGAGFGGGSGDVYAGSGGGAFSLAQPVTASFQPRQGVVEAAGAQVTEAVAVRSTTV